MKNYIILLAIAGLLGACEKDYKCDDSLKALVTTNSPVVAGDALQLSVSGIDHVMLYKWSGPNGFSSNEQNPVIPDITSYNAGVYTVDVFTETGCIYRTLTDSIEISGAQSSCDMTPNTAVFRGGTWSGLYSSRHTPEDNMYEMTINSSNGDMHLTFKVKNNTMASGVYSIYNTSGDFDNGMVKIDVTSGGVWDAVYPGKVYVSMNNGYATVSFCDLSFISGTFSSATTTGSLLVTER
jgi:hypothetical protein